MKRLSDKLDMQSGSTQAYTHTHAYLLHHCFVCAENFGNCIETTTKAENQLVRSTAKPPSHQRKGEAVTHQKELDYKANAGIVLQPACVCPFWRPLTGPSVRRTGWLADWLCKLAEK